MYRPANQRARWDCYLIRKYVSKRQSECHLTPLERGATDRGRNCFNDHDDSGVISGRCDKIPLCARIGHSFGACRRYADNGRYLCVLWLDWGGRGIFLGNNEITAAISGNRVGQRTVVEDGAAVITIQLINQRIWRECTQGIGEFVIRVDGGNGLN